MTIQARIPVIIAGALAATTIAGVAAFASPATGMASVGIGSHPSHMASMMDDADTVGEMHRVMHPQMGGDLGDMHRSLAGPTG